MKKCLPPIEKSDWSDCDSHGASKLKLVLFLWAACTSHFTWFSGFTILSVRYSGFCYSGFCYSKVLLYCHWYLLSMVLPLHA